ncbi:uncharacterized protein LOC117321682 [Pecten maximus]|uniref:uncharacterized protein LOC117321682 n=1 Tax=Pecten maximus TaxID=6579 RepID=UPI0014582046|nr:uncharacterized protein LOC117321682 [Pecten maximus]
MLVLVLLADITMTGLAGVLLDTAYNCNARTNTNTAVSQKFCTGLVSKLYDLSGVFIGLTVWHSVLVALLIWLCMSLASKANGPSSISPTEHSTRRTNNRSDSPASLGHSSPDIVVSEFF